jgi:predicted nucleic acid-binding protein
MYLLDTNVVSETRKPSRHLSVMQWLAAQIPSQLFIPSVVFLELQRGVEFTRMQNPARAVEIERWIDLLVSSSQVIDFDVAAAREYSRLRRHKQDFVSEDAMIAAIAKVNGYTLVTRNAKDFAQFGIAIFNPFPSKEQGK